MNDEALKSQKMLSVISKLPLFSRLNRKEFDIVAAVLKTLYVKEGEILFKEGDPGEDMFIHFSGTLNAFAAQSDGTQRLLFDITLGEFFGEMSIVANTPRSATIIAEKDSVVIKFRGKDFYDIISKHPLTGFKILRSISIVQNRWLDKASTSVSDLVRWGETARRRAITDEMTGLYNRRFLEDSIKERFNNKSMEHRLMALLMMDLDKIHDINDLHGTKAGDIVITAAADSIRECLRPGDIAARLAGDEFSVLLFDTDKKEALKIAERIRETIENHKVLVPAAAGSAENVLIGTKTSIGIAIAPTHANTAEEFEENADAALRKAKEHGRNRVEIYNKGTSKNLG